MLHDTELRDRLIDHDTTLAFVLILRHSVRILELNL
jgi:hypothetical protein